MIALALHGLAPYVGGASMQASCRVVGLWASLVLATLAGCGDGGGDDGGDDDGAMPEPPDEPALVTRSDPEPAGANCAAGGTAVHAGLDEDGDCVLDDDEIDRTEFLCDLPSDQLVREDELPPDEACPAGGSAIHTGSDDDGDGVLAMTGLLSIGSDLRITENSSLASLEGLSALTTVGDEVVLDDNPLLSEVEIQAFLDRLGF
jgi:hypothetical protein